MRDPSQDPTDWLLTSTERGNPSTRLDDVHPGDRAWSEGNLVRPLIHGATYFAELYERLEATRDGDLVLFTDWQGDFDERLTGEPGSEVGEVLCRADERGVDVRGLVWRSHSEALGFTSRRTGTSASSSRPAAPRRCSTCGSALGGSHHQKMVVIRHRDEPERDIAYVGGIDLCHSRRDDADHLGDPQAMELATEYGATPPGTTSRPRSRGPAVHDVETVFRERWLDPTPLSRSPLRYLKDRLRGLDLDPDPLPEQAPPPPAGRRRHPRRPAAADLSRPAPGPRLPVRQRRRAERGPRLHQGRGAGAAARLRRGPVPLGPPRRQRLHRGAAGAPRPARDRGGAAAPGPRRRLAGSPQLLGRRRAMLRDAAAPRRTGSRSTASRTTPARRSTCTPSAASSTTPGPRSAPTTSTGARGPTTPSCPRWSSTGPGEYARRLRLTLAAEHLDRASATAPTCSRCWATASSPAGMFAAYADAAAALDAWHAARPGRSPTPGPAAPAPAAGAGPGGAGARAPGVPDACTTPTGGPRSLRRSDASDPSRVVRR